jgi:hypothetical protein
MPDKRLNGRDVGTKGALYEASAGMLCSHSCRAVLNSLRLDANGSIDHRDSSGHLRSRGRGSEGHDKRVWRTTLGSRQVKELPLNGRSYDELITLNPGILNYTSERSGGVGVSNSSIGNMFAVSGHHPQENNFLLNGIEFTSASEINLQPGGSSGEPLGVDAIREFNVVADTSGAEYGKRPGAGGDRFCPPEKHGADEKLKLQLRAEFFNIFNSVNFNTPNAIVLTSATSGSSPTAGVITSTSTTSRQIQFGLNLIW